MPELQPVPERATAEAEAHVEVNELPWQVETVQQSDIHLAAKLERDHDTDTVLGNFLAGAGDNRRLIAALTGWPEEYSSPFINVRIHVTPSQFDRFADALAQISQVDIRDFQAPIPEDAVPWPIRQIQNSDQLTARELQNCENLAEKQHLLEQFVTWLGNNREIFRALEAWDAELYGSPFKATMEQLSGEELKEFEARIEDITGRDLF